MPGRSEDPRAVGKGAWRIPCALLGLLLVMAACVERELFIQSDPSGAVVCLDGKDRGVTPLSVPFHYYGERFLELRLRDHRVERVVIDVAPPWYQVFPMDFFTDLLWPETLWDTHVYFYKLTPYKPEDLAEEPAILQRAEELRSDPFAKPK